MCTYLGNIVLVKVYWSHDIFDRDKILCLRSVVNLCAKAMRVDDGSVRKQFKHKCIAPFR